MRTILRTATALVAGLGVFLFGQLAIENIAWWWTNGTATFDDPLLNAIKVGGAVVAGLAMALAVGLPTRRRHRLL